MEKTTENIISKIKKILELSKHNPSVEEAKSAALKAQKLMAEYHISMEDIEGVQDVGHIAEKEVYTGNGNKWKYALSKVIADNFRCRHYYVGKSAVVFYGYEEDATIAAMAFEYLFKIGNRGANNYYQKRQYQALKTEYSFSGKGLKNAFLAGYIEGIKEVLEEQCTALMLVVPQEVKGKYEDRVSGFGRIRNTRLTIRAGCEGDKAMEAGVTAGKNAMMSRSIEVAAV